MTFNKFKKDLLKFLRESNVNLGRSNTKTKKEFLDTVKKMLDNLVSPSSKEVVKDERQNDQSDGGTTNFFSPNDDRIMKITPKKTNNGMDIGKGAHGMTQNEAILADEQLNRSPLSGKSRKEK